VCPNERRYNVIMVKNDIIARLLRVTSASTARSEHGRKKKHHQHYRYRLHNNECPHNTNNNIDFATMLASKVFFKATKGITAAVVLLSIWHLRHDFTGLDVGNRLSTTTTTSLGTLVAESTPFSFDDETANNQRNAAAYYGCLSPECIEIVASSIAKAFADRSDHSWCVKAGDRSVVNDPNITERGLILTKVPKASSSTAAGVAIRISGRNGCDVVNWKHKLGRFYRNHDKDRSFLFTTVRNPGSRAMSSIWFHVLSRNPKLDSSDEAMIRRLEQMEDPHYGTRSSGQGGFTVRYVSLEDIPEHSAWTNSSPAVVKNPQQVVERVRRIFESYSFLIASSRMDESLVALALVMGVPVSDVLVVDSKVSGGGVTPFHYAWGQCWPVLKGFTSDAVKQYLQSDQWRAANYGDYILEEAALQSLDLTIDKTIGRELFNKELAKYRYLKDLGDRKCSAKTVSPCSSQGELQLQESARNCYVPGRDFGCGYACIDKMLTKYRNLIDA